jgi:ABC-type sugar transport system permease subunit/glycerophosphoryl diester phosphodiesterase
MCSSPTRSRPDRSSDNRLSGRGFGQKLKGDGFVAAAFLLPSLAVFSVFVFAPLGFSFYLSLTGWNLISPEKPFVGLKNFSDLAADQLFWKVMWNTVVFSLAVVVLAMVIGLFLASLLNNTKLKGRTVLRTGLFLPYVTTPAAMALVWLWIFDAKYGLLNLALGFVGINGIEWIGSVQWALPALVIMTIWRFVGYDMLIFLAGLQRIERELIEAATVEGAKAPAIFFRITLPLLSPTTLFIAVTSLITMFQNFETVYIMTQGGPVNSTNMIVLYLYQNAFQFFEAGYASAIAVILFILMLLLTALQLGLSRGAAGEAPENTLAGFAHAFETAGVRFFELDVHLTRDGELAVIHDDTLDRTTSGTGRVGERTMQELRALDASAGFGPSDGVGIPSLREVLEKYAARIEGLQLEIKTDAPARIDLVCARLLEHIREYRLEGKATVTSFDVYALTGMGRLAPDLKRGLISSRYDEQTLEKARAMGCRNTCIPLATGSKALVQRAQAAGLEVTGWLGNTRSEVDTLVDWGVDSITTNFPSFVIPYLRDRGLHSPERRSHA